MLRKDPVEKSRKACKKKFLYYFKKGYADSKYFDWERGYKWKAHEQFRELLSPKKYKALLDAGKFSEIAMTAVKIESGTNLLFSFEKMALRDAVKTPEGAKDFATGLYDYAYGKGSLKSRFENFVEVVGGLPRRQTRVLTWPLLTVFGFLASPEEHIFLKPMVTRRAAEKYMFDFQYKSKPNWDTYQSLFDFAAAVREDTKDLQPKDYIDLQSFIWVMGSDEYPD